MQSEDFVVIKTIAKHMVTLANGAPGCTESRDALANLIQSHDTQIISTNIIDEEEQSGKSFPKELDDDDTTGSPSWFDDIVNSVKEKEVTEIKPYYQPKLSKVFKKLFDRVPLWSAVMKSSFGSNYTLATSNDTESRFHTLKAVVFKNETFPLGLDVFCKKLIPFLESVAKLANIAISQKYTNNYSHKMICLVSI